MNTNENVKAEINLKPDDSTQEDNIRDDDTLTELNKNTNGNEKEKSGIEIDKVNSKRIENIKIEQIIVSITSNTSCSNSNQNYDDEHHSKNETVTARVENVDGEINDLLNMQTHEMNYLQGSFDEIDTDSKASYGNKISIKKEKTENSYTCDWKNCGISFLEYSDLLFHKKIHLACHAKKSHTKIKQEKPNADTVNSNNSETNPPNNSLQSLENNRAGSEIAIKVPMEPLAEQEKNFKCEECDKKFMFLYTLVRHRRKHAMFKSKFFKDPRNFIPEGEKKFKCEICDKKFLHSFQVKRHSVTHINIKPFSCSQCNTKFRTKGFLTRHIENYHPNLALEEMNREIVNQKSKEIDPRNFTSEREKKFKCEICDKKFVYSFQLKIHKRTHTNIIPFSCSQCNTKFRTKGSLTRHIENYHPHLALEKINRRIANQKSKEIVDNYESRKNNYCDLCGKNFTNSWNLKMHRNTHTGEQPFECSICDRKFSRKNALNRHSKTCKGKTTVAKFNISYLKRENQCEICTKRFLRPYDLKRHRTIHAREQQFECPHCHLKISRKKTFDQHIRNHKLNKVLGSIGSESINAVSNKIDKKFECSQCDRKYSWQQNLHRHIASDHPSKKLISKRNSTTITDISDIMKVDYCVCDWNRCGRSFLNYSDFIFHTAIHLKEYRFQCSFGFNNIKTTSHLMGHIETSRSMDSNTDSDRVNVNQISRNILNFNWKCYCFVRRLSITEMKSGFIERKIKSETNKRFKCDYCGMKFSLLCNLKGHIFRKNHIGNKLVNQSNKIATDDIEMIQRVKKTKLKRTKEKIASPYINSKREPRTKRLRFEVDYCEPLSDENDTEEKADHEDSKTVLKIVDDLHQNQYPCNECDLALSSSIELKTHKKLHILKTTGIGIESSRKLLEDSEVKSENTNIEIIELTTSIKIEKEEPDVVETQSTVLASNSCYDEAICKEELILFD